MCDISSLNDSNGIPTHSHLVRKPTLNHSSKPTRLDKCMSVPLRPKWLRVDWVEIAEDLYTFF